MLFEFDFTHQFCIGLVEVVAFLENVAAVEVFLPSHWLHSVVHLHHERQVLGFFVAELVQSEGFSRVESVVDKGGLGQGLWSN